MKLKDIINLLDDEKEVVIEDIILIDYDFTMTKEDLEYEQTDLW